MLKTKFWQRAAASLPGSIRERHIGDIARAERFELLLEGVLYAWSQIRGALARALVRPTHQH